MTRFYAKNIVSIEHIQNKICSKNQQSNASIKLIGRCHLPKNHPPRSRQNFRKFRQLKSSNRSSRRKVVLQVLPSQASLLKKAKTLVPTNLRQLQCRLPALFTRRINVMTRNKTTEVPLLRATSNSLAILPLPIAIQLLRIYSVSLTLSLPLLNRNLVQA